MDFHLRFLLLNFRERHVNVLENFAGRDAQNAVAPFDEVIAFAPRVFTAENVGKGEAGGELLSLDQEACAIGDPRIHFHTC